ncbi:hypothetical protein OPS25_13665 [Alteromonas ponticola]|uniref:DUF4177 domain-containing protein n=1 Tax=Alteromonas aquimaris TaxID=2998417 RepID=A0ABT3P9U3_9ALTE|nr:hypothetical protein [Alteromonas aquimaris]MCW8109553.1 hypothetical protein [Alteromonas aquimaris]
MYKMLRQKITASRFKRHDLGIIENIPADVFQQIIDKHIAEGWEISGSFHQFDWTKRWEVKLRKGTSELQMQWYPALQGNMVGLRRIMTGVAKQFSLTVLTCPSRQ